jgi:hypothetical protein
MKASRALLVLAAALPLVFALSVGGSAEGGTRHTGTVAQHGRRHGRPHGHPHPHKKKPAATAHHIEVGRDAGPAGTVRANPDAGVLSAKTLDGGTRVFRFSELDVEGRLRSPQIVYFLRRVRAEFAAGDLGHRSFMGELSETRKSSAF